MSLMSIPSTTTTTTLPSWRQQDSPSSSSPSLSNTLFSTVHRKNNIKSIKSDSSMSFTSKDNNSNNNNNIGKINMGIFAANSSGNSPRKRNRLKMEEAFRTMSIEQEQDFSFPSRKRQELWPEMKEGRKINQVTNYPSILQTQSFDQSATVFPISNSSYESIPNEEYMEEEDDDSDATPTTTNSTYENEAVKQVMYSLVFGSGRPTSSKEKQAIGYSHLSSSTSSSQSSLAPLSHVDAKIEQMIRNSRLQALVMTGKPKHFHVNGDSITKNDSFNGMKVRDDFNVSFDCYNNGSIAITNNTNMSNNVQDCEMSNDILKPICRPRSKSFDDLEMSI